MIKFELKKTSKKMGKWKLINKSLLIWQPEIEQNKDEKKEEKIAGFDLDGTLITTKTGNKFALDENDWKWWDEKVKERLKEEIGKGYKIVIMTNQNGVDKGKITVETLQKKLKQIIQDLGEEIIIMAALKEDHNRKPNIGIWNYLQKIYKCNKTESYYVGDAAGRPQGWRKMIMKKSSNQNRLYDGKKDHSACDRKMALNIGLKFYTPEEFFFNDPIFPYNDCIMGFDPSSCSSLPLDIKLEKKQEMVLLVGLPSSGKSSFCKTYFPDHVRINMDTLKTSAKCIKKTQEALKDGDSVIIDNTNPDIKARLPYLQISRDYEVPIRCFWLQTPLELCTHLNLLRENISKGSSPHVPSVAFNTCLKRFVQPSTSEGFSSVTTIPFSLNFNLVPRNIFLQWT